MRATELFVEQVLIGLAVLATGGLIVVPDLVRALSRSEISEFAIAGVVAYLLGILYDRFADTLLQDLEQHHRLFHALRRYHRNEPFRDDPFPEDEWRHLLLFNAEASNQAHYYRSRMRLMRSLATLTPALGVAVALNAADSSPPARWVSAALVAIVYAACFLAKNRPRAKPTAGQVEAGPNRSYALPATKDLADKTIRGWYEAQIGGYDAARERPKRTLSGLVLATEPLAVGTILGLAAGAAAVTAATATHSWARVASLALGAGTVGLTALFGWSWWRIAETYLRFLGDFARFSRPNDLEASRGARPE